MQLDVKRPLDMNIIINALDLAKEGRCAILDAMAIQPRPSLKETAPRVEIVRFDPNRKRGMLYKTVFVESNQIILVLILTSLSLSTPHRSCWTWWSCFTTA